MNIEDKVKEESARFLAKIKSGFSAMDAFEAMLPRILKEQELAIKNELTNSAKPNLK